MVYVPDTRCSVMPDRLANESTEFEITPEMIEAGIRFMEAQALNTVSTRVTTPEFIKAFYLAIRNPNEG